MLVDMHLHECTYSTDSFLHLEEIVSIARQKGLDAICITDHDSMGLRERAEAYSREIGYPIFVGVEFFSLWGDITAWGIDGIPDQRVGAQDFIDLVREKDGFCVVGVSDLMFMTRSVAGIYYKGTECYLIAAIVYLFLTYLSSLLLKAITGKMTAPDNTKRHQGNQTVDLGLPSSN